MRELAPPRDRGCVIYVDSERSMEAIAQDLALIIGTQSTPWSASSDVLSVRAIENDDWDPSVSADSPEAFLSHRILLEADSPDDAPFAKYLTALRRIRSHLESLGESVTLACGFEELL